MFPLNDIDLKCFKANILPKFTNYYIRLNFLHLKLKDISHPLTRCFRKNYIVS